MAPAPTTAGRSPPAPAGAGPVRTAARTSAAAISMPPTSAASRVTPSDQNGFSRGGPSPTPPSDFFPQEFEQRKPGATLAGRDLPSRDLPSRASSPVAAVMTCRAVTPSRDLPSRGGYGSGPQVSARDEPPWPGPARQEPARQESARPDYGRPPENGRTGEYGRPADYGRLDLGRVDLDRPAAGPGQDFPRRDPGRGEFSAYSTYSGQPEQAEQAPPPGRTRPTPSSPPGWTRPCRTSSPRPSPTRAMRAGGQARPPCRRGCPAPASPAPASPGPGPQPGLRQSGPMRTDPGQAPPRRGDRDDDVTEVTDAAPGGPAVRPPPGRTRPATRPEGSPRCAAPARRADVATTTRRRAAVAT